MPPEKPYFTPAPNNPNLWTVMIYMAGDNDLDNYGISDLREIKRVGSSDQVQVIAELDRRGSQHVTKRYWLKNQATTPTLKEDVLEEFDESDSGSPEQLTKFIKWGIENFQAERYFVIIWAHGAGAYDEDLYYSDETRFRRPTRRHGIFRPSVPKELPPNGFDTNRLLIDMRLIAPDDQARSFIDNVELKRALQDVGRTIEVLGMDACLMSMIEVCYQLKSVAEVVVSSEAQEPLEGWPYEAFLRQLTRDPQMKGPRIAEIVVDEFVNLYKDYEDSSTTLAACDLSKCDLLKKSLGDLADLMLENFEKPEVLDAIMLARYLVQADNVIEAVDLYDFCELLAKKSKNERIVRVCESLMEVFDGSGFIINRQPLEGGAAYWHGLGIYFPGSKVSTRYADLDIVQPGITRWKDFIDAYVSTSGR